MPVRASSATALVRCTGLALICINERDRRGEIGYIRDNKHVLTIKIRQPFYEDETNDVVTYRDVVSYNQLPNENVCVQIKAHGVPVAGVQPYLIEPFARLGQSDENDFRWLVNLQELHGENTLVPTLKQPYCLTRVNVLSGLFYTHQLDEEVLFTKVKIDANGVEGLPEDFGQVGKTLGVRLEGDKVTVSIRSDEIEAKHTLSRVVGLPAVIELSNVDPDPNAAYSDMPVYDGYVVNLSGERFELRPKRPFDNEQEIMGNQTNQEDFCHPVVVPLESLDQL